MATKRCLPTRFFKDADIMNVSKDAQLILVGLVLLADDEGRELAHLKLLSREIDYLPEQIEAALQELVENDLVILYQAGKHRYYHLTRWSQWQSISSQKMTPSRYPAPPVEGVQAVAPTMHEEEQQDHYSCTCVRTEEDIHVERRSKLERVHVSLEDGRHLLQTADRQLVGDAQRMLVIVLVDPAMGSPGARWAPMLGVAVGGETPLLPHEAERGDAREPLKPLWRIGHQFEGSFVWADDHIGGSRPIFDYGDDARTSAQFRRMQAPSGGGEALWWGNLASCFLLMLVGRHIPLLLHLGFERAQPTFIAQGALLEQFQCQLGQLLLHACHGSFQTGELLAQIGLFRHGGRQERGGLKQVSLTFQ
jgi:hypothetical protein